MGWLDGLLRHRGLVLGAALLLTVPALLSLSRLESQDTYDAWFPPDDPAYRFYREFQRRFENDMFIVVAYRDETLFTREGLAFLAELTARLAELPYVREVTSLTNVEHVRGEEQALIVEPLVPDPERLDPDVVRQRALSRPLYRGLLISEDGTTTAVVAELDRIASMDEEAALVGALKDLLRTLEVRTGKSFYIGGYPVLDVEIMQASERDIRTFIPLTVGAIFLVLWGVFRRPSLAALAFVSVSLALAWTFGLYAGLGLKYSMMLSILPTIILAIGIADAVHILVHYYEELARGRPQREALRQTLRKMLRPCLFTTLTTGAGFISFLSSDIPVVRLTGLFAAVGIGLAFVLTVLVLPAAVSFFRPPHGTARRRSQGTFARALEGLTRTTLAHPRAVLLGAGIVLVFGLYGISRLEAETLGLEWLRDDHPLQQSYRFIEENLTGLYNLELIVEGERDALRSPEMLRRIEELSAFALQQPGVRKAISVVDYVKEIHRALRGGDPRYYTIPDTARDVAQALLLYEFSGGRELREIVSGDYSAGRLTLLLDALSSREYTELNRRILERAETLDFPRPVQATGAVVLVEAMLKKLTLSQVRSLGLALALITLLMIALLRSWKLGLLSLIPNGLPILLMFATMGLLSIPLDAATSTVAGMALGIAVDDTIHFLTRFRRELNVTGDYRRALTQTARTVGQAIVFTSVILLAGFSVLLLGSFKGTVYMGLLVGLTMLFALVGDLVLLPALLWVLKPLPVSAAASTPAPAPMADDGRSASDQRRLREVMDDAPRVQGTLMRGRDEETGAREAGR